MRGVLGELASAARDRQVVLSSITRRCVMECPEILDLGPVSGRSEFGGSVRHGLFNSVYQPLGALLINRRLIVFSVKFQSLIVVVAHLSLTQTPRYRPACYPLHDDTGETTRAAAGGGRPPALPSDRWLRTRQCCRIAGGGSEIVAVWFCCADPR